MSFATALIHPLFFSRGTTASAPEPSNIPT